MNFKTLKHWLLPHMCLFCKNRADCTQDICEECLHELPFLVNPCSLCAKSLAGNMSMVCGECLKNPPPFACTVALFSYQAPITHLIMQLKFNQRLTHARLFSEFLLEKILTEKNGLPDIIIPLPLHKNRLQERGFNQSVEIAKPLAKELGISLDTDHCFRIKQTLAQAQLTKSQRYSNIKDAFHISKKYSNLSIAVVDDVITTGATVTEFCRTLKAQDAQRIDVWCVARA